MQRHVYTDRYVICMHGAVWTFTHTHTAHVYVYIYIYTHIYSS